VLTRRPIRLALVGALAASLLSAAPAAAVTPSGNLGSRTISPGIGIYNVYFSGIWSVTQIRDAGKTWWWVTNVQGRAQMVNGSACRSSNCSTGYLEAKADFLTTTGAVYRTTAVISGNSCYLDMQVPADNYYYACTAGPWQLPTSVNRIRYSMRLHVFNNYHTEYTTTWITKTFYLVP
jgi:hypothetical protein